ncbi:MAG: glycoside hydrolase family 88 protein [Bacillus sp. (in: Bacteria)]|nr:glycoside hydrolase family 88 protein [Bacillus sp. (in: firmicutes)]MCM1426303.1 glycoside hydrolase family 88 protein [Eubacterium sp.]
MEMEKLTNECFDYCSKQSKAWNYKTGVMLIGAQKMYEATGEEKYFSFIKSSMEELLAQDGALKSYPAETGNIEGISCGRILYFLYDKTKEDKYRKAVDNVMDRLRDCPRCECGNFLYQTKEADESWLDVLYMTQPFYMEYETTYDKKEKYNDIINQFKNVRGFLYNKKEEFTGSGFSLKSVGAYLAALIDTMDNMSFEIYEQYRTLQDAFKLTLKSMLPCQDKDSKLFSLSNGADAAGNAMMSYAVMKACRMGIVLKEKYADSAMKMIESLSDDTYANRNAFTGGAGNAGTFLMAYGQYLQLKKEMDENG